MTDYSLEPCQTCFHLWKEHDQKNSECRAKNDHPILPEVPFLRCSCLKFVRSWPDEAPTLISRVRDFQEWCHDNMNILTSIAVLFLFIPALGFGYMLNERAQELCHLLAIEKYGPTGYTAIKFNPVEGCEVFTPAQPNATTLGIIDIMENRGIK